MKYGIIVILTFINLSCVAQDENSLESIHPCNLIVTLFGKELKCGVIKNVEFAQRVSCTSDTSRFVSHWIDGKSRPKTGYAIQYSISELDNTNYTFNDSSYYLSQTDFSWYDSVGEAFLDTASFELVESIAERYTVDHYKNADNRIYIDRSIPIRNQKKKFAIRTNHAAILITMHLPSELDEICIYDQYQESTFNYCLRLIFHAHFRDEENAVLYEISKFK